MHFQKIKITVCYPYPKEKRREPCHGVCMASLIKELLRNMVRTEIEEIERMRRK